MRFCGGCTLGGDYWLLGGIVACPSLFSRGDLVVVDLVGSF